jgi:hypothetical protein
VCKKDKESHYQFGECERNSRIAKEIEKQIRDDKAKELKKFQEEREAEMKRAS